MCVESALEELRVGAEGVGVAVSVSRGEEEVEVAPAPAATKADDGAAVVPWSRDL